MIVDLPSTMLELAKRRPVFHSEADLQHELARQFWLLDQQLEIRLELPSGIEGVGTTDMVLRRGPSACAIELKYLAKHWRGEISDEVFNLRMGSASDQRCFDVVRDVHRLERWVQLDECRSGFVLVVTNDASYWKPRENRQTFGEDFRIGQDRRLRGKLAWGTGASAGTKGGRADALELKGTYELSWRDFSDHCGKNGRFRYLLIEVSG